METKEEKQKRRTLNFAQIVAEVAIICFLIVGILLLYAAIVFIKAL